MEDQPAPASKPISPVIFVIVAVGLVALLLGGLYVGKQYFASTNKKSEIVKVEKDKNNKEGTSKKQADSKARKAAEEKKKAQQAEEAKALQAQKASEAKQAEAKKQADAKAQAEAAAATQAAQTPTAATTTAIPGATATGSSSTIASTGPTEVISFLVGLVAVSYGVFVFLRSRRELAETTARRQGLK